MSRKTLIWIFMSIGTFIGSILPELWGGSALSLSSVILSAIGGIGGIYLGFKMGN